MLESVLVSTQKRRFALLTQYKVKNRPLVRVSGWGALSTVPGSGSERNDGQSDRSPLSSPAASARLGGRLGQACRKRQTAVTGLHSAARQQRVHGFRIGEIHVAEGASLVAASLQRPARLQCQFHKGVFISAHPAGSGHCDAATAHRVHRLQGQAVSVLVETQSVAFLGVLAGGAQGIAIAVQIAAADSREIKVVQNGVHQPVLTFLPAEGSGFDLLQHQKFPAISSHGLGQDREPLLVQRTAVKQSPGQSRQASCNSCQSHRGDTQRSFAEVGSAHGPVLLGVQEPCCTEEGVG